MELRSVRVLSISGPSRKSSQQRVKVTRSIQKFHQLRRFSAQTHSVNTSAPQRLTQTSSIQHDGKGLSQDLHAANRQVSPGASPRRLTVAGEEEADSCYCTIVFRRGCLTRPRVLILQE